MTSATPESAPTVRRGVSRLTARDYPGAKRFYRSAEVALDYDRHRLGTRARRARNRRKWRAILAALEETRDVRSILDLPCGTGRFTGPLAERGYLVVGGDVAMEMIRVAAGKPAPSTRLAGFVQADAEALPLSDAAVDCVISIRFMLHVDPGTRVRILREMARVSRRWLIVDYRHRYCLRYARWRLARWLGLTGKPSPHLTRGELERELASAGWSVRKVLPVTRIFSDKWIVVGESKIAG